MKLLVYIVYRYDYIHRIHNKNSLLVIGPEKLLLEY